MVHELKRPFRDATTECLFEPLDFLARLAALVLRPRKPSHPLSRSPRPKCPPPPPRRAAAAHAPGSRGRALAVARSGMAHAAAARAAPTRRPRFLPVSAAADNARTANHHPAPTPRIPTVEILKLTVNPGFSIYYPLTPHKTLRVGDQNISRCRSDEPRA